MRSRKRRSFNLTDRLGSKFRLTVTPQFNETIEECVLRRLDGRKLSIRSYKLVARASLLDEEARRQQRQGGPNGD